MANLGQRVKTAREMRGMSQSELARRVGVRAQSIQDIEARDAVRTKYLLEISDALEVRPTWLQFGLEPIEGDAPGALRPPSTGQVVDRELLAAIIEELETAFDRQGRRVTAHHKAEIVAETYRYVMALGIEQAIDEIRSLLQAAAKRAARRA